VIFYVGLHQPSDGFKVGRPSMFSVNRLRKRRSPHISCRWVLDSGAFTQVALKGGYDSGPGEYAREIRRWAGVGQLVWAAAQDFMCEPFVLCRTGGTVASHQRMTIERYDELVACDTAGVPILPVLQGYYPDDYRRHLAAYGDRLRLGMPVGVGSVCKRNASVSEVAAVLRGIKRDRPDLLLHGFGLKRTALGSGEIRAHLASADSMAWSFCARKEGRSPNDWREAQRFHDDIAAWRRPPLPLFGGS
jgi:hypothetical protein